MTEKILKSTENSRTNNSLCGAHPKTPKLSIVIPAHNQSVKTKKCLESIKDHTFSDYEVVYVDNGSYDSDYARVESALKEHTHQALRVKKNLGYFEAVRRGVEKARSNIIIVLDNDTKTKVPNWDYHLIKPLLEDPTVRYVVPLTNSESPHSVSSVVGRWNLKIPISTEHQGYSRELEKFKNKYVEINESDTFCIAMQKKDFSFLDFSLHFERPAGKILLSLGCLVYHDGGTTFQALGISKERYLQENARIIKDV